MRLPFAQVHFKQLVSLLAHRVGKVVVAIRVLDQQILRPAVELVDLRRGGGDAIHAVPLEVRVPERRVDEADTRREGSNQLVEVEGDFLQPPAVAGELAHVTCLAPAALRLPVLLVAAVGVETATGDDDI